MSDEQPGFKKLKVPGQNGLRPNASTSDPDRGPLQYVQGVQSVQDFGAGINQAPSSVKGPVTSRRC